MNTQCEAIPAFCPPRQQRAKIRVESILEAAARLIAARGMDDVNMRQIAEEANASLGSLYRFFPSQSCLFKKLADNHAAELKEISEQLQSIGAEQWRDMNPLDIAGRLLKRYVGYIAHHPDFIWFALSKHAWADRSAFVELLRHVLSARMPLADDALHRNLSEMFHTLLLGGLAVAARAATARSSGFWHWCLA